MNINKSKKSLATSTFVHSAALDAIGSLLNARALPALPILDARFLQWRFGAFRMALHVAIDALGKVTFVAAHVADIHFGFRCAAGKSKFSFSRFSKKFSLFSPVRSRLIGGDFFFFLLNLLHKHLTTFLVRLWFEVIGSATWTEPVALWNLREFRLETEHVPAFVALVAEEGLFGIVLATANHAADTLCRSRPEN